VINANGTIAKETNGRNYSTSYTYDKNLRVTKVTPPVGNAIAYSYPANSSYRKETRGGFYTKTYFDGFGRPTGTLNSKGVQTDIDYNAYGCKTFTSSNIGDKVSFDVLERPIQAVHKDNKAVRYIYSGNTVTVKDEANNSTVRTYNAFGCPDERLLVAVRDANGKTAGYNYNILGNLTTTSYGGITRRFGYNSKNFLTSESNPETGSITYGRDNVGNLTRKTDGTGTLSYSYDAINRLTKIAKGTEIITIGYDKADNRTSLTSPAASYSFVFDKANRLTAKNETILGRAYASHYAYDGNDNLASITYPGSRVVGYQYNAHNEVTAIPGMVSSATYNLAGQPLGYTCDNGLSSSFTYNARYLPTGMSAGSVVEYTYDYNSRGNTIGISNELDASKDQTFAYDKLNRITTFNGAWGSGSFTYDVTGNRLTKTIEGGRYPLQLRIQSAGRHHGQRARLVCLQYRRTPHLGHLGRQKPHPDLRRVQPGQGLPVGYHPAGRSRLRRRWFARKKDGRRRNHRLPLRFGRKRDFRELRRRPKHSRLCLFQWQVGR